MADETPLPAGYCDPNWHGRKRVPASFLVTAVTPFTVLRGDRETPTGTLAYKPTRYRHGGYPDRFACCPAHLSEAVSKVLAANPGRVLVHRL